MKFVAFCVLAMLLAAISGTSVAQDGTRHGGLVIEKPWSRASIGTSRPAAAYLTIRNEGKEKDTLVAVSTPLFGSAEVHHMTIEDSVMRMGPAGRIDIPAGGSVALAPGGLHIMIMKLKSPLVKGKTVDITLTFARAGEVTVTAPIYGPGATKPE